MGPTSHPAVASQVLECIVGIDTLGSRHDPHPGDGHCPQSQGWPVIQAGLIRIPCPLGHHSDCSRDEHVT